MVKRWNDWFKLMGPSITTPPAAAMGGSRATSGPYPLQKRSLIDGLDAEIGGLLQR